MYSFEYLVAADNVSRFGWYFFCVVCVVFDFVVVQELQGKYDAILRKAHGLSDEKDSKQEGKDSKTDSKADGKQGGKTEEKKDVVVLYTASRDQPLLSKYNEAYYCEVKEVSACDGKLTIKISVYVCVFVSCVFGCLRSLLFACTQAWRLVAWSASIAKQLSAHRRHQYARCFASFLCFSSSCSCVISVGANHSR